MDYFEERFKGIIENFKFSMRMYRDDWTRCEPWAKWKLFLVVMIAMIAFLSV